MRAICYLVYGNVITEEIERSSGSGTALPVLDEEHAASLIRQEHIESLMANLGLSEEEAHAALGLIDGRQP